jgi:hypothetical protein
MPAGEMGSKSAADGRYRTLLEVSGAIASQPNLKAVLQSLRRLALFFVSAMEFILERAGTDLVLMTGALAILLWGGSRNP